MPYDSQGVYSLPTGYLAVTGETIQASQHNPPLEDIAAALNSALLRTGVAPMSGALKAAAGTVSAPGVTFSGATSSGLYKRSDGGLGLADLGVNVGAVPVGAGMDFWGTTAPAGWVFAYGQALSRTTYAELFAAIGTTYGNGNGSSTFNVPDKRDRASFGKGNMGGTAANRITNQSGGWEGDTLGAAGGSQTAIAPLPAHTHAQTAQQPQFSYNRTSSFSGGSGSATAVTSISGHTSSDVTVTTVGDSTPGNTGSAGSGDGDHNNLPPGIVCNYIIFTGVYS